MNNFLNFLYRLVQYLNNKIRNFFTNKITLLLLYLNKVEYLNPISSKGIPKLYIHKTGKFRIGNNLKLNNTLRSNPIGRGYRCVFVVREKACLIFEDNIGMSGVTIVCHNNILIKSNVKIGGNVCIYDTDFHSLDPILRANSNKDKNSTNTKPVIIEQNAFIGAHTTILKGVTIGENSIIGACSVVTKNIPKNEIWAGNPIKFIRKL